MKRRIAAVLLCIALLLSLSGCSFVNLDVETQLRAPHAVGEQSAIQTALEHHIYNVNNTGADSTQTVSYVLKYPQMGEYRSAFVMKDIDGDGTDDALAFYALQPEGANTHIALLKNDGDGWRCADDIEGLATEIERITFADLNGDGLPELFAGFSMYNTRDRRLMLYTWSGEQLVSRYSDTYSHMIVGRIMEEERDDLLLFRLNAENEKTTVRLLSMENQTLVEQASAQLDGHILQFGDYAFATFDEDVRGVFQDCTKDLQTTITELIVWDGEELTAPLYDPVGNITSLSARKEAIPSMDIDRDGEIEWPRTYERVTETNTDESGKDTDDPDEETDETERFISEWYSWDHVKLLPEKEFAGITNLADGYYMTVPDLWLDSIKANYDETTRTLTVKLVGETDEDDQILFDLVAFPVGKTNPHSGDDFLFLDSSEELRYEIRYTKDSVLGLSMEQLSDLFVLIEK